MGTYRYPFTAPTLFLASPGDVSYLRNVARGVISEVVHGYAPAEGLNVFSWEIETATTPFDDLAPAQEQFPPPDDPLCRGVIAFFGEWIGRPLAADFPLEPLAPLRDALRAGPYHLVHPWREDEAGAGGFPLTGSTFEVLTAIATHRRARKDGSVRLVPLFLRFVGPKSALDEAQIGKAAWGHRRLRKRVQREFEHDDDARDERLGRIRHQLLQLRNFARFVDGLHGDTAFVDDEHEAASHLRYWLEHDLALAPMTSGRDPFKGLAFYDVGDADVFYGREHDIRGALEAIRQLWAKADGARWHWVRGVSGAGKSSFLRAGIVGHLVKRSHDLEAYADCVVRHTDLIDPLGAAGKAQQRRAPLRILFESCLTRVLALVRAADAAGVLTSRLADFDRMREGDQPAWAARVVGDLLRDPGAGANHDRSGRRRLLLGFDQFEDIVDLLGEGESRARWEPVVRFAIGLSEGPGVLVLATLREDRIDKMRDVTFLDDFYRRTSSARSRLELPGPADLEQVIRRPFKAVRDLALGDDLVSALTDRFHSFSQGYRGRARGGLLPLLSVTLSRLYRDVASRVLQEHRNLIAVNPVASFGRAAEDSGAATDQSSVKGDDCVVLTLDMAGGHVEIERAISTLADEAVAEAKAATGPNWEDAAIEMLMRRLVRWAGETEQLFNLPPADPPTHAATAALARALQARRLILDEQDGHIQLVHEAVIENWPPAKTWFESEKSLLTQIGALTGLAGRWGSAAADDHTLALSTLFVSDAARLLALWFDMLETAPRAPDPEGRAALRDFCLALLARHDKPADIVADARRRPPHLHLAAAYQRADIVRSMVTGAPESVDVKRSDERTALFLPAFNGNLEIAGLLLDHGADPNAEDDEKWRPLHAASMTGTLDVVARLVQGGARVDGAGAPDNTAPIHLAAANDRPDLLEYFVKSCGVAASLRDSRGVTPIMRAAMANGSRAIRTLASLGGEPDATTGQGPDDFGWTALHLAARDGAAEAIDALLDLEADVDRPLVNGATALHVAAHNGRSECIRRLAARRATIGIGALHVWDKRGSDLRAMLDKRTDRSARAANHEFDTTPLHMAVAAGHAEAAAALLEAGANANALSGSGATPLHVAAANDRADVVSRLVAAGADMERRDAQGRTPFHEALERRAFNAARALLDQGASSYAFVEMPGRTLSGGDPLRVTPMQKAAGEGNEEVMRFLLRRPQVELDTADARGWTALHYAAAAGRAKFIGWLLTRGARPQLRDASGLTALHVACRTGDAPVVKLLLSHYRPDWSQEHRAASPLHLAAHVNGSLAITELLGAGHPVDLLDAEGWTPLHLAAQAGAEDCVALLLRAGAHPLLPTRNSGLGPLQLVSRTGDVSALRALLRGGVSPRHAPGQTPTPALLAMRHRHYGAVVELLTAGAPVDEVDAETGLSLAQTYVQQIVRALSLGITDARDAELEQLFASRGVAITVPEAPAPAPTSNVVWHPGGTAFFPDMNRAPVTPWSEVSGDELAGFLAQITPVDGKYALTPADTRVHWRLLPFYETVALIHVSNPALEARNTRLCYLTDQGNLYRLNGTSPPIHEVNAKGPIKLNERNVLDYLRFFCFFVRGEEGPFYIAESADDPLLPQMSDETAASVVSGTVRPATFEGMNEQRHFLCEAVISYSNAIFIANFAVQPTGMVEMLDDEPIAADLPGRVVLALA